MNARKRARPGEGTLLRVELLNAAETVLDEHGEEAVTVRGIAALVGVSTPSVYMHFPSRQELLHAVCLRVWERLDQDMRDAVADVTDPFTALHRRCVVYISFGLAHPLRYRLVMSGPATQATRQITSDCFRYLAEAVKPCIDIGALIGDVNDLTRGICAGLHGAVALLVQQPADSWPTETSAYVHQTATAICFGAAALGRLPQPAVPSTTVLAELLGDSGRRRPEAQT